MPDDVIAFDGFEVAINLDRWPAKILRALLRRHYEKHELRLVSRLLEPADRVLELGSAIGVVALAASRTVAPQQIACFDANPDMVAQATKNFERNAKPIAAGNAVLVADASAPGTVTFYKTPYFLSSSLSPRTAGASPVEIPTMRLADVIEERRANSLIVDIEGGEFDLLGTADLGAIEKLVLEIHVSMAGVAKCLELIAGLRRQDLHLDANLTGHNVFVFTHSGPGAVTPENSDAFAAAYLSALEKSDAGDRAGAIEAVTRAIEANPLNAHAHLLASQLLIKDRPLDRALAAAERAVHLDPRNEDAFEQLGVLHSALGNADAAQRAYNRAIELVPHRPLFHAGLGAVLLHKGLADQAIGAFESAVRLCPERAATMRHILALASRQDKAPDADTMDPRLATGERVVPERFLAALSEILAHSFRFADAGSALKCALQAKPDDLELHCGLAALVATPANIRQALASL